MYFCGGCRQERYDCHRPMITRSPGRYPQTHRQTREAALTWIRTFASVAKRLTDAAALEDCWKVDVQLEQLLRTGKPRYGSPRLRQSRRKQTANQVAAVWAWLGFGQCLPAKPLSRPKVPRTPSDSTAPRWAQRPRAGLLLGPATRAAQAAAESRFAGSCRGLMSAWSSEPDQVSSARVLEDATSVPKSIGVAKVVASAVWADEQYASSDGERVVGASSRDHRLAR